MSLPLLLCSRSSRVDSCIPAISPCPFSTSTVVPFQSNNPIWVNRIWLCHPLPKTMDFRNMSSSVLCFKRLSYLDLPLHLLSSYWVPLAYQLPKWHIGRPALNDPWAFAHVPLCASNTFPHSLRTRTVSCDCCLPQSLALNLAYNKHSINILSVNESHTYLEFPVCQAQNWAHVYTWPQCRDIPTVLWEKRWATAQIYCLSIRPVLHTYWQPAMNLAKLSIRGKPQNPANGFSEGGSQSQDFALLPGNL